MPDRPMTSRETAARLRIDVSTLSRWVKDGRLTPAMRLPGKSGPMLFDPADVERLAAALAAEDRAS